MKTKLGLGIGFCLIVFFSSISAIAQNGEKYFTKDGHVSFYSETKIETIEADNHKATSVLDSENGKMEFAILIKAFEFEKALMQEHFNENYMDSDEFPKAIFKGAIANIDEVNFGEAGTYNVRVEGDLTIHGVTQAVSAEGTLEVDGDGGIKAVSEFPVKPADYDIKIPSVVVDNIAEEMSVKVNIDYKVFKR